MNRSLGQWPARRASPGPIRERRRSGPRRLPRPDRPQVDVGAEPAQLSGSQRRLLRLTHRSRVISCRRAQFRSAHRSTDLIRRQDTEITRLPWVNRRSRRWEPAAAALARRQRRPAGDGDRGRLRGPHRPRVADRPGARSPHRPLTAAAVHGTVRHDLTSPLAPSLDIGYNTPTASSDRLEQTVPTTPQTPFELYAIDSLLTEEERAIRDTVGRFVDDHIRPEVGDWFETGRIPARELARDLGELGVLGMHLQGYGCAGTSRPRVRPGLPRARGRRLRDPVAGQRAGLARDVRHPRLRQRGPEAATGCRGWRRARPSAASA